MVAISGRAGRTDEICRRRGATVVIALIVALALDALKLDPRGTFVGTYVQRNALVVGFAMGFAIIPLIYTIADDALVDGAGTSAIGLIGGGGNAVANGGANCHSDCRQRTVFGADDRAGPRGGRNDDRADGRRQHAGDGLEYF